MILSSTSPYGLLKEFSIACGVSYNAIFRSCHTIFVHDCRTIKKACYLLTHLSKKLLYYMICCLFIGLIHYNKCGVTIIFLLLFKLLYYFKFWTLFY